MPFRPGTRARLAFAFLMLPALNALAQLDRGTITGTIKDEMGAVVPGTRVTIRNRASGSVYKTGSTGVGQYTMPNLPVGLYTLKFEAEGFKASISEGVRVKAASVLRVDVVLELGPVEESVVVAVRLSRVQSDSAEVSATLDSKSLIALPLSYGAGRSADQFAFRVMPGVIGDSWTSFINGSTAFSNDVLVEGASVTTNQAGEFVSNGVSLEAIEELKVQTSGMSAEFGRTQAGVFNFVMKSGGNQVHGSAYGSLRNEVFNANSLVNKARGLKRSPDRKQNYAFSFGGPVYLPKVYNGRNKTFFFAAYERYRERSFGFGTPNRTAPLPEFYDGDFSRLLGPLTSYADALGNLVPKGAIYDPATFRQLPSGRWMGDMFPGNRIPVSRISPVSQRLNAIAKAHYLPTVRDAAGKTPLTNNAYFPISTNPILDIHQASIKVDQIINERHKLSGMFNYNYRPRFLTDQGGLWDITDQFGGPLAKARWRPDTGELARLSHDWTISPRVLNHFTASYNRRGNPQTALYNDVDGARELGIANLSTHGYPEINWGGGPFVSPANVGYQMDDFRADVSWGAMNTVSFSHGRHFIKTGIDVRRSHQNNPATPRAGFNFNARSTAIPNEAYSGTQIGYSFASYLLGIVDSASLSDPVPLGGRRHYYGLFVQDDFKVSSRLTLNLGLRWDYQPPFFEVADRFSSWNTNKIDPATGLRGAYDFAGSCQGCTGQRYFGKRNWKEFGPRVGFAWRPVEKWTIRAAYGIMYEGDAFNGYSPVQLGKQGSVAWGGTYLLSADPVQPWAGLFNWNNGFPTNRYVPGAFNASWGNTSQPGMIDPNYGLSPYVQQWNINIQHELAKNLVLDIGYVGNKGTRLREGEMARINQLPVSALSQYGTRLNNAVRNAADAAANGIAYPYPGFTGTVASALRAYPQVQGNSTVAVWGSPLGFSTYNALQITLNRQFSRGLSVYGNYTWSKTLSNVTSSLYGDNTNRPLDYYNLKLEKSLSEHDIPHMVKACVSYDLPIGRGKAVLGNSGRLMNAVFGGWSISTILNGRRTGPTSERGR